MRWCSSAALRAALLAGLLVATAARATAQAPERAPASVEGPAPLERLLAAELSRFPGTAGVYVKHLGTGEEAGVRAEEAFESASTIKVAILAYLYRLADAGQLDLDERVELQAGDLVGGSGIFRYKGVGLNPSIRDLIVEMIVTSDNTATDMLLRRVGGVTPVNGFLRESGFAPLRLNGTIFEFFRKLFRTRFAAWESLTREDVYALCCAGTTLANAPGFEARRDSLLGSLEPAPADRRGAAVGRSEADWFGVATPAGMGRLLEAIERCTIAAPESCEEMRRILRNTQASGLPVAGALQLHVPFAVGHKTGATGAVTNDVGIIYAPSGPIIVAFYNKDIVGPTVAAELRMAEVARLIVEYFEGAPRGP